MLQAGSSVNSHLGEDAADGPDVDGAGVLVGAEQDLGSAVPQGDACTLGQDPEISFAALRHL